MIKIYKGMWLTSKDGCGDVITQGKEYKIISIDKTNRVMVELNRGYNHVFPNCDGPTWRTYFPLAKIGIAELNKKIKIL